MEPLKPLKSIDFHFASSDVESPHLYQPGGYHPVHLGDIYCDRYKVIHKLGFGSYSTVWLARDLNSTTQTRYVALKITMADLTGRHNEIKIHRHLALRSGTHPGSDRVLALLDHFKIQGPNGEHDVLVSQVVGPHLEDIFEESTVIPKQIKSLTYQVALGISFLHDCGVVHADLHQHNVVFEVANLDGKLEHDVLMTIGVPNCAPVLTRDRVHQAVSFPKYLVIPGSLESFLKQDDLHIKIIDLGGAFFSTEVPPRLHTPLEVRAPEILFNHLSPLLRVEVGARIDVWSMGCLIYELATSLPLIGWYPSDEAMALRKLTNILGPLPEEWIASLGASYVTSTQDTSVEQMVRSIVWANDTPEFATLLQQIFVFDPLRRPDVSDLLNHPWFAGSPSSISLSAPA